MSQPRNVVLASMWRWVLAVGGGTAIAAGAAAQLGGQISDPKATQQANPAPSAAPATGLGTKPPVPLKSDSPPTWLYYLVLVGLGGATVVISIMPSKRGHQE